jgi:Na+:H+ antiporter, NhaA family
MEIKRELVVGELNSARKALLPAIAALGGMILPAGMYFAFNRGGPGQVGWGIPMATDIAFCVGVMTLLGKRAPRALVVFLIALAIFDDIGGILVIAVFYGHGLHASWLIGALAVAVAMVAMNRAYVTSGIAYAAAGAALWYALHHGGIHATIAGVVLGLCVPARPRRAASEVLHSLRDHLDELGRKPPGEDLGGATILSIEEDLEELEAPLDRFVHALHAFVAFLVMPLFALANSGVALVGLGPSVLLEPVALGAGVGLLAGKLAGIFGFTLAAVRLGIAPMPTGTTLPKLFGAALVAGIGFTVALFIAGLAFDGQPQLLDQAKIGILAGSLAAGVAGFAVIRSTRVAPELQGGEGAS